jgi:hypothetical protein
MIAGSGGLRPLATVEVVIGRERGQPSKNAAVPPSDRLAAYSVFLRLHDQFAYRTGVSGPEGSKFR